jgi:hypothetical protein
MRSAMWISGKQFEANMLATTTMKLGEDSFWTVSGPDTVFVRANMSSGGQDLQSVVSNHASSR